MTLDQTVLAEIDGGKITAAEMIASMKSRANLSALSGAIEDRIVRDAAGRAGLKASDAELQKAADAERQRLGLFRAADTQEWLKRQGLSVGDLERGVELSVLRAKLREQVTAKGVQNHFDEHKASYAVALISAITVADRDLAGELASQIADEGADFLALAAKHNPDEESRARCGSMGYVARGDLPAEAARLVFAAKPGAVVGPVQLGKTHALIKVWSVKPATLDEPTREAIADDLFGSWLGKLLDKAKLRLP